MIRTRTVENMIVVRPKPEAEMDWELFEATSNQARVHLIDETQQMRAAARGYLSKRGCTKRRLCSKSQVLTM